MSAISCVEKMKGKIDDITECALCLDTMRDPRVLPCVHSFCLECLQTYGSTTDISINCPLCRKPFILESGGFEALPINHFINKLIDIHKIAKRGEEDKPSGQMCDVCIFIKNLDKSTDAKALHDAFSKFGKIVSSKIAMDEHVSKGYGFVEFETEEAARNSIEKGNGMLINDKIVFVSRFMTRPELKEMAKDRAKKFTNVHVKNFGDALDDYTLRKLFERCGSISSCTVMRDENGKSRGFGFVDFKDHEAAQNAVKDMNNKEIEGRKMYVERAQTKAERGAELKERFQSVSVYVKNLDDTVDDEMLRKEFTQFGTITSAKVRKDCGKSRGVGFVCFSSLEEATRAVDKMNGHILVFKPMYVALARPKEDRKAQQ